MRLSNFTESERQELAVAVTRIAEAAGAVILRHYASDPTVRHKKDGSPVTAADEAAEALILERLSRLTPTIPVVAEESAAAGHLPALGTDPGAGLFWLVDPLDGTREFLSRNGEFTVNLALIEDGRPRLGAVHIPITGVSYFAAGPGLAFRSGRGPASPIAARSPAPDGLVVVASRSHRDPETEAYLARVKVKEITSAGSSLKFCLLAEGAADLYPRFGRTMEWDTAAGHAVLAAAHGSVRQEDGSDLVYGKAGFANPPFIARGLDAPL